MGEARLWLLGCVFPFGVKVIVNDRCQSGVPCCAHVEPPQHQLDGDHQKRLVGGHVRVQLHRRARVGDLVAEDEKRTREPAGDVGWQAGKLQIVEPIAERERMTPRQVSVKREVDRCDSVHHRDDGASVTERSLELDAGCERSPNPKQGRPLLWLGRIKVHPNHMPPFSPQDVTEVMREGTLAVP